MYQIFKKNTFPIFLPLSILLMLCSSLGLAKNAYFQNPNNSKPIEFFSDKSTLLYATKATSTYGNLKAQNGRFLTLKENAEISWEVIIPRDEIFELFIIANITNEAIGEKLYLAIGNEEFPFKLTPTKGPYKEGKNFQKVILSKEISLKEGKQKLTLKIKETQTTDILLDFRSLEFLPISEKANIENKTSNAISSRESVSWMVDAGYGLMFHWTSESVQPNGSIKNFEDAVNEFDVAKFTNMVHETGSGYVVFTIGHAESFCPAPIESWEKVHPGQTTRRDLINEIAESLNKKGIKLICYINGPLGFKLDVKGNPTKKDKDKFRRNFNNILNEMGTRYKDKIAGYWFDSWYQIFEEYPDFPFKEFNIAAKSGNDKRVICLNSWIYPSVSPWQDYWAGEVAGPIDIPKNGYMVNGPVPNLPYQALLIMEPYWVQQKEKISEPLLQSASLSEYIKKCNENGGSVTINLGIYQNGFIGEKAFQIMKEVKEKLQK